MKSVGENRDLVRKRIISSSSLPTANFSTTKELKAVKILNNSAKKDLGIVKKSSTCVQPETKKARLSNSLVGAYGSGSDSD